MKVLQVNCVYNSGSTGKIMYDIHSELERKGYESVICYGRGKKTKDINVYKTCGELYSKVNNLISRITGIMYGGCFFSTKKLISIIKKEKPDIVHLHCINGYFVNIYKLISWLKKNNINTVLTLHAEFMYTANCGHAYECNKWKTGCGNCPRFKRETKSIFFDNTAQSFKKMKNAFDGFDDRLIITSVSPWLMERAKLSPILKDKKHCVVLNGLDTNIFKVYDNQYIKDKYNIKDEKVIFHATAFFSDDANHIKGGRFIIELANRLKSENVKILVAGAYKPGIKVPDNLVLLGSVHDQTELARLYSAADITVIASKRETFSMICAESLCCGTPIVGFKAGGPESIAIKEYSKFCEYGNVDELEKITDRFLNQKISPNDVSRVSKLAYSGEKMGQDYFETYLNILG